MAMESLAINIARETGEPSAGLWLVPPGRQIIQNDMYRTEIAATIYNN